MPIYKYECRGCHKQFELPVLATTTTACPACGSTDLDESDGNRHMPSTEEKLERERKSLLDLGLRNTLLNYKELKTRGLTIVDERPNEVFRILVTEGRKMSFKPTPDAVSDQEDESSFLLSQPNDNEDELRAQHVDTKLKTPYSSKHLQVRLRSTQRIAQTSIEEQGVNVLYLALGMLEWFESDSSDEKNRRKAPLVLVPVELSRSNIRGTFRINFSEEDLGANLSLQEKLKADFGIELPELPPAEDLVVDDYLREVNKLVSLKSRWRVDTSAIVLAFFSFTKLLMYRDLNSKNWLEGHSPAEHSVIDALLGNGFKDYPPVLSNEERLDDTLGPNDPSLVLDADSSQVLAILEAKTGRNMVIQGPPGTGKSQTITNFIAEAVLQDKTVLFVCEKLAALEVVKRKLDSLDLGVACLELHSNKARKALVLGELNRTHTFLRTRI